MNNHRQPRADEDGFTLIEVLLSLMITALLFAGVFFALDQSIRSRNEMANRATPHIIGPAILDRIAGDLQNAFWYDVKNNNALYGTDAELGGSEADAISFLATSRTYMDQKYTSKEDFRHSFLNEVAYLCRRGGDGTPFMELWRREDFFVDDYPHSGGDYVLLYDKVQSLKIQYVSRNPESQEAIGAASLKDADEMLQDGWNSIQEAGMPRAIQVTLVLYAPDDSRQILDKVASGEARTYEFKRFISLPGVHESLADEQAIANWDGTLNEATVAVAGANARNRRAAAGAGGRNQRGRNDRNSRNNRNTRGGRNARGGRGNQGGAAQSLLNAFRSAGAGSGRSSGGSNPFSSLINR